MSWWGLVAETAVWFGLNRARTRSLGLAAQATAKTRNWRNLYGTQNYTRHTRPSHITGGLREAASYRRKASYFGAANRALEVAVVTRGVYDIGAHGIPALAQETPDLSREFTQAQQFVQPRQAYTQRQKAIQAIHASGMTTRSALGHEASYMHM